MARLRRRSRKPEKKPALPPPLPALLTDEPSLRALLTPVLANAFSELDITVSLWVTGDFWYPIHHTPSPQDFEYDFGVAPRRWAYNRRCLHEVEARRNVVRGKHAGLCDLFVPVRGEKGSGVLVAGPFATDRPSSAQILERWYALSGEQGHLTDPQFADYVASILGTLTLAGSLFDAFEGLLRRFADIVAGRGNASVLGDEATGLRKRLVPARFAERMWETARVLVHERTSRTWGSHSRSDMELFRLRRSPEHVLVGLARDRMNDPDPLAELLRRAAFQRRAVDLAAGLGDVVCGRVGDHGITLLVSHAGGGLRSRLVDLATRARAVARRHGFDLHVGIDATSESALPTRYHVALAAAERALSRGTSIEDGAPERLQSAEHLGELRRELGASIEGRPDLLASRFDGYIEAVLAHTGYRLEPTRTQLEAGLERLAEPLLDGGFIDKKTVSDLYAAMARTATEARTVADLLAAYRPLVASIEATVQDPKAGRHERSTQRALGFIREHLTQQFSIDQVARIAGFAPDYFARMFRKREGMPFARYVRERRVERAMQMLLTTTLTVSQIQRQCGFKNRAYFHRLFLEQVGSTPLAYRAQSA